MINSHQLGAIDHPPDRRLPCAHRKVRHTPAQFRHHDGKGAGTERGRGKALAYMSICALPRACRAPAALRWGVLFGQRWPDNDLSPSAAFCSDRRPERALAGLRSRKPRTDPTATTKCHVQMLSKDGTAGCSAHVCGAQAWVGGGGGGGKAREGEGEGLTAGKRGRESRCVLGPTSSPPGCSCTESTSPAAASFAARSRRCCGCRAGAHRLALWPGSMLRLE